MATATLTDIVERMRAEGSLTRNSGTNSIKSMKSSIQDISNTLINGPTASSSAIESYIDFMQNGAIAEVERSRELLLENEALREQIEENTDRIVKSLDGIEFDKGFDFGGFALNLIAAIMQLSGAIIGGLFVGALLGAWKEAKVWGRVIKFMTTGIMNALRLEGVGASIALQFTKIATRLKDARIAIGLAFDAFKGNTFLTKLIEPIAKYFDEFFKSLRASFNVVKAMFTGLGTGGIFKPIAEAFKSLKTFGSSIGGFFKGLGEAAKVLGGFFQKLFVPLRAVMVLYETYVGIMDGFAAEGLLGGIKGALKGFFKGMVGDILNLIKDAVSWVAEQLGFDKFASLLDGFDFNVLMGDIINGLFKFVGGAIDGISTFFENMSISESLSGARDSFGSLVTKIVDSVFKFFSSAVDGLVALFTGEMSIGAALGNVGNAIQGFYKKILQMILPTPDSNAKWFDIGNLLSKAIPDEVYAFAGLNPETGALIPDDVDSLVPNMGTSKINAESMVANESASINRNGGAPVVIVGGGTTDNSVITNNVDSRSTQVNVTGANNKMGLNKQGPGQFN
jgi:hypothetical protein|tara:strand:- start:3408 stop:5105 length:1698 start_codon:yes stop_codon:yes gene_type:complete